MCEMTKCLMDEVVGHTAQSVWMHVSFKRHSGYRPHLDAVLLSANTALATLRILDLLTRLCSHMQGQETGLDGPAGRSLTALKPIKATWVCSHAWLGKTAERARLCARRG